MNTEQSTALEKEACALVKQYGFFLPSPVRAFLTKMADSLNWNTLKGML
ncbi:hypothetical protein GWL_18360 [Herbaspirillum sp. GW103]|nr:hypothetical protein [Herbaspirillum sp. GW103]EIJ47595.1 hypothetical protein GWL_18360 [Herbaspirillum sp. GW103]